MWPFSKKHEVSNDWMDTVRANIMTDIYRSLLFPSGRSRCKPAMELSRPIILIKYEQKKE